MKLTIDLTLDDNARPDEIEAALRNCGAWAGRMCQDSCIEELTLIRWAIPCIACVQTATLYREMDAKKALNEAAVQHALANPDHPMYYAARDQS